MYPKIELVENINSEMRITVSFVMLREWIFTFDSYIVEEKKDRQRKWRITKQWNRLTIKTNTIERPELSPEILNQIKEQAMEKIKLDNH